MDCLVLRTFVVSSLGLYLLAVVRFLFLRKMDRTTFIVLACLYQRLVRCWCCCAVAAFTANLRTPSCAFVCLLPRYSFFRSLGLLRTTWLQHSFRAVPP